MKVQDATIASNWAGSKATITKTKYKDTKITFSDGDEIASITTSNKDIVTAKKQGALAAGDAGKLIQNIRVTAGTKAGTGKITVKLRSGKSIVLTVTVPKVNCTGITAKSSYTVTTLSTMASSSILCTVTTRSLIRAPTPRSRQLLPREL